MDSNTTSVVVIPCAGRNDNRLVLAKVELSLDESVAVVATEGETVFQVTSLQRHTFHDSEG